MREVPRRAHRPDAAPHPPSDKPSLHPTPPEDEPSQPDPAALVIRGEEPFDPLSEFMNIFNPQTDREKPNNNGNPRT